MRLVVVRHGRPTVERGVPAPEWRLAPSSAEAVAALAAQLSPGPRVVVTSPEPKAVATATLLFPDQLHHDPLLREVERPVAWDDEYEQTASRYLRGQPSLGWEPVDAVRRRMVAATRKLGPPSIVVGHGLAISLLVASLHDVDVVSFWRGLRMPDAWTVAPHLSRIPGSETA